MADRYSGDLKISVVYDDRGFYRTAVSREGRVLWRGRARPPAAGFGRGVAYDEVAQAALAFGDEELSREGESLASAEPGFKVRRVPRFHEQYPGGSSRRPKFSRRDKSGGTSYRIVWKDDKRNRTGVLVPGPLTLKEAQTVLKKVHWVPGRREVIEAIRTRRSA